jgi:DNA-directed RNA polymerase subunit RPC12/RpoP
VCSLCQRPLHQAQVFFATSEKHGERPACCPRCGLRFVIESNGKPLLATDFSNGKRVNAADAVYLEGSDLMQCCATPAVLTESGTVCDVHFDRCMPSLVAFAARTDAETYRRQHGGRLVTLAEATASVARQMGK